MKLKMFIILLFFHSLINSSNLSWVATGPMWTFACVNLCYYPSPNETSYNRGNGLCLWAHIDLSEEDKDKVWTQKIKDSSGAIVFQHLIKIIYDRQEVCFDGNYPDSFPNGYGVYYYSPENRKYFLDYCLKDAMADDKKYDLIGDFDPGGCGMTNCLTHLGHYTYEFYEEGNQLSSATFWMVPDFEGYYDKFYFDINGGFPYICDDNETRKIKHSVNATLSCSDWEGADIQIDENGTYSTWWLEEDGMHTTAHYKHFSADKTFSVKGTVPNRCKYQTQSFFGNIVKTEGKLPKGGFYTDWEAGNLSGVYKFKAKVSKVFDGRKFEKEKTDVAYLQVPSVNKEVIDTLAYKWKIPDNDIHYPYNKFMQYSSINTMDKLLTEFLEKYIWTQEGRENVRFVLTSANLYRGGFFDEPEAGAAPPWQKHHTMHRMGYNIDISRYLSDGFEFDDDPICNEEYINKFESWAEDKTKNRSFCDWHKEGSAPHWHCNFK